MIAQHVIDQQLKAINATPRFFGRPEVRELSKILFEGEIIRHLIFGRYEGGWATLCATDRRVLLVDKKPFYLTIEDLRYDMVSDVQYDHRLINACIHIGTVHKSIHFTAYNHDKLRAMTNYVQEQVAHVREQPGRATEPRSATASSIPMVVARDDPATRVSVSGVATVLNHLQQEQPSHRPINPYRAPIVIRKRVSRFY